MHETQDPEDPKLSTRFIVAPIWNGPFKPRPSSQQRDLDTGELTQLLAWGNDHQDTQHILEFRVIVKINLATHVLYVIVIAVLAVSGHLLCFDATSTVVVHENPISDW